MPEKTMQLTPEEINASRDEIKKIVVEAITEDRLRRMTDRDRTPVEKISKLFLISFAAPMLAFPDENGRAVLNHCVYGRVSMPKDSEQFYGGWVEVIGYNDGRKLNAPIRTLITGHQIVGLAEVSEERFARTATA